MSRFSEDPFLCKDCQKLGYCRLRAMQAEAERRAMQEKSAELNFRRQTSFQFPMLSADPEPMPTLREFVAVHRPDLSKHLPKPAEAETGINASKRPSLAELRARIAARKTASISVAPAAEQQLNIEAEITAEIAQITGALSIPETVPSAMPAPVALFKRNAVWQRNRVTRLKPGLLYLGEKPVKHQYFRGSMLV
jgi:hypothetical protein